MDKAGGVADGSISHNGEAASGGGKMLGGSILDILKVNARLERETIASPGSNILQLPGAPSPLCFACDIVSSVAGST